jgi:hypothetical protein
MDVPASLEAAVTRGPRWVGADGAGHGRSNAGRAILGRVNDGYLWWLMLVGAVIALAVVWILSVRLPRDEADVSPEERRAEAAWISRTIERYGGVAPEPLVEEVLELHAEYLASPGLARVPGRPVEPTLPASPRATSPGPSPPSLSQPGPQSHPPPPRR